MARNPDKSKKKIIVILTSAVLILSLLIGGTILAQKLGNKGTSEAPQTDTQQEVVYEPEYLTDDEFNEILEMVEEKIEEESEAEEPVVIEEFENGDKVVVDEAGETYISPSGYAPDLLEAARSWAEKNGKTFRSEQDLVVAFKLDDAYIAFKFGGSTQEVDEVTPDTEVQPIVQQPTQQPTQQPQQGNQGQQQEEQTKSDRQALDDFAAAFGLDPSQVVGPGEAGDIGYWELPDNVHIE